MTLLLTDKRDNFKPFVQYNACNKGLIYMLKIIAEDVENLTLS